jgi:hypothetical protein
VISTQVASAQYQGAGGEIAKKNSEQAKLLDIQSDGIFKFCTIFHIKTLTKGSNLICFRN